MRVLLVSPKDPQNPKNLHLLMGGENTYTNGLLSHPPEQVEYIHQTEALRSGLIEYNVYQKVLSFLMKIRLLPPDAGYQCFNIKGKFNLIHIHSYCAKLTGNKAPVIMSDSSSNYIFLRDYLNWGKTRISVYYAIRKIIHQKFHVFDQNLNLMTSNLIVWTNYARKVHLGLGAKASQIKVIKPGLKIPINIKKRNHRKINILFVGNNFVRKGGLILLTAFEKLLYCYPNLHLTILGSVPHGIRLPEEAVSKPRVTYRDLISIYYPEADIFVLCPPKVEGYGLVLDEAMSFGIPAVVSDVCALPERVIDGRTGFIVKAADVKDLQEKLERLVKSEPLRKKLGANARKYFLEELSLKPARKMLFNVYRKSVILG